MWPWSSRQVVSAVTKLLRCATFKARVWICLLWAGQLLTVALLAAPNAFATLTRPDAGAYVARLFLIDARISLGLALLTLLMEQRLQRQGNPGRIRFTRLLLLPVAILFLTVAGYDALQPLLQAAKAGQGSFALLHGLSMAAFGAKTAYVLALAWFSFSSCFAVSASRA